MRTAGRRIFIVFLAVQSALLGLNPVFFAWTAQADGVTEAPHAAGHVLVEMSGSGRVLPVRTPGGLDVSEVAGLLRKNAAVRIAEPDYTYRATAVPNDPGYAKQWYLDAVKLPEAWNFAKGSPTVIMAILDSGVDLQHPDLRDRIWTNPGEIPGNGVDDDHDGYVDDVHGWNFVDNNNDPNPVITPSGSSEGTNHGTLVAGVIGAAGNNLEGVTGVNWNVRLMPLRVLDSQGSGSTLAVVQAVRYAIAHQAKVINISFTGTGYSQILAEALRDAYRAGIVIVAAAGNEGDTERGGNLNAHPEYPVCYKGAGDDPIVIGVSSLDRNGRHSSFSSYGSDCVGISAPGENFYTTQVYRPGVQGYDQPYGEGWSGSSLAAPLVAGTAALISSMNPGFSPAEIRKLLYDNAVSIDAANGAYAGQIGVGELNAGASVLAAQTALLGGAVPNTSVPSTVIPVPGAVRTSSLIAVAPGSAPQTSVDLLKANLSEYLRFQAYAHRAREAPSIAMADIYGDGEPKIVVGAPRGELPYVRVFTSDGALISHFLAYAPSFRGGVNVSRIDLGGNGKDEIMTGPGPGGGSQVRFFSATGKPLGGFLASAANDRSGIRVAAADLSGNGIDEIITAPAGPKKTVKVFGTDGKLRLSFNPFERAFPGGIEIAAGDLRGNGIGEIVAAPGTGGPPLVAVFDRDGKSLSSFSAFSPSLKTGVTVAVETLGGAEGKILAGLGVGGGELRILNMQGTIERQSFPFGPAFRGGIRAAGPSLLRNGD